jgi:hypothetical protein
MDSRCPHVSRWYSVLFKNINSELGVVVSAYNPSTQEAEVERCKFKVPSHPGYIARPCLQSTKQNKIHKL